MTSLGIDQDLTYRDGGRPYVFKIRGQLYHRIGSLLPDNAMNTPKFAQLWVIDAQEALQHRQALNPTLDHNILLKINDIVKKYNPYFEQFKSAFEHLWENEHESNFRFTLVTDTSTDQRRYNMPVANEIAALVPTTSGETIPSRDIIVQYRGGGLQRIFDTSPLYLPLYYVLLCPREEQGWSYDIPKQRGRGRVCGDDPSDGDPESNFKIVSQ